MAFPRAGGFWLGRVWALGVAGLLSFTALGQVPAKLGFQGQLRSSDGTPMAGTVSVTFALYSTATAGTALWSETQSLALSNGFYATQLGSVNALPPGVFADGRERYVEITVGATVLSPRQKVGSVAYALRAGVAWHDGTLVGDGASVAMGVNSSAVQSRVSGTCGAGTYVTGVNQNGTVICGTDANTTYAAGNGLSLTGTTFSIKACAAGQVLKWNGATSTWDCGADANAGGTVTSVTASAPLASSGGATPNLSLPLATAAASGYLSASDWSTFNGKVSSSDSRLSDARAPIAGSSFYIQNQSASAQSASFSISGNGLVGSSTRYLKLSTEPSFFSRIQTAPISGVDIAPGAVDWLPLVINHDNGQSTLLNRWRGWVAIANDVDTAYRLRVGGSARIDNTLYVGGSAGIGTATPGATLGVAGTFRITSTDPSMTFNETDTGIPWEQVVGGDQWILKRNGADMLVVTNGQNIIVKGNIENNQDTMFSLSAPVSGAHFAVYTQGQQRLFLDATGYNRFDGYGNQNAVASFMNASTGGGYAPFYGYDNLQGDSVWINTNNGWKIYGSGSVSQVIATRDHGTRVFFAPEYTEEWLGEVGQAQLAGGHLRVNLDPAYQQSTTIDTSHPMRIQVTPTSACAGLYVVKDATGFDVYEVGGGRSNATFDWEVKAKSAWTEHADRRMPRDYMQTETSRAMGGLDKWLQHFRTTRGMKAAEYRSAPAPVGFKTEFIQPTVPLPLGQQSLRRGAE